MDENKRPMSGLYLLVPGLGQVYCGEVLRGIAIYLATYVLLFLWLLGSLWLLDFLGFPFLNGYLLLPFLLGLAVWAFGAWDAYTWNRKMLAGEIPWKAPERTHLVLFIVAAVVLVFIGLAVTGLLLALFGFAAMISMFSYESRLPDITLTAEKTGGVITIQNIGNETADYAGFTVVVNGQKINGTYRAEPRVPFTVNSTNATDRVVVSMVSYTDGMHRTLLNTTV